MSKQSTQNKPQSTDTAQGQQQAQPFSDYLNLGNSWLEILVKLVSLLVILGIVLGGFFSFDYLFKINHLSIFSDVISSSDGFLAILFVFLGAGCLILSAFLLPYFPIAFLDQVKKSELLSFIFIKKIFKEKKSAIAILFPCLVALIPLSMIISVLLDFFCERNSSCINFWFWCILILLVLLVFIIFYIYVKREYGMHINTKYKGKVNLKWGGYLKYKVSLFFLLCLLSTFVGLLPWVVSYLFLSELINMEVDILYSILIFVSIIIFIGLVIYNSYVATDFISDYQKGESKLRFHLFIPLILTIVMLFIFTIIPGFSTLALKVPRFVETPINSQWYLLHNNFQKTDGSQEINGINTLDLKKIKGKFEINKQCSKIGVLRGNALYGYMAWNLGQTKIFCPPSADNRKGDDLSNKCLVINGNLLQPLPKDYIGADSTPDKGNWSINMNQKMNVLIREPQPESCTDRCVIQQ